MPQALDQPDSLLLAGLPFGPEFEEVASPKVHIDTVLNGSVEVLVKQAADSRMNLLPRLVQRTLQQRSTVDRLPEILHGPGKVLHHPTQAKIRFEMIAQ